MKPTYPGTGANTYGKRTCPTCNGTGINPVWPSHVCPRCNGERVVPVKLR